MSKINIVFWTQGGNTQMMAEAIADGVRDAGKEAEVVFVSSITPDALKDEPVFALGCPAMGAEVLEEAEMEPFVAEVEGDLSPARGSHSPVHTAGEMASGCATGRRECSQQAQNS